jgi:tRNA(Ile)-lysidine synthase
MDFLSSVKQQMKRHRMWVRGDAILLAVSGGADSMAMLEAMFRLRKGLGVTLGVAHVDHGLRGSSALDCAFVKKQAAMRGLPFHHARVRVREKARAERRGIEESARDLRYAALLRIAGRHGYSRVATAHTASDQAETVLMRIISGTGTGGLSGILPVLDGVVIRPMLQLSRRDIDAFMKTGGVEHVEDETNADTRYTRNAIRHLLVPLLEERFNPSVVCALARLAENARAVSVHLDFEAEAALSRMTGSGTGRAVVLDRAKLNRCGPAVGGAALAMAAGRLSPGSRLDSLHIQAVLQAAADYTGPSKADLPGPITVKVTRDTVEIRRSRPRSTPR